MIDFLKQLIQAESTAETGELEASNVICNEFASTGIDCYIDTWDTNRANCVAQVKSTGSQQALLFVCHHDVVPPGEGDWRFPPFSGVVEDGKIHGRGTTDMKGGTAAAVMAICEVVSEGVELKGDILFSATAGEETDSCGVKRFVQANPDLPELAGIIIPEPTAFDVISAHRGLLWLEVITKGQTAHGSTPQLGINAISAMRKVLDALDDYTLSAEFHPRLGPCSMSVNTIRGGKAHNVVPDRCTLGLDIRTLPGQDNQDIITDLESLIARLKQTDPTFDAEVSLVRSVEALETDTDQAFVKAVCQVLGKTETQAVGFTTDGPALVSYQAPILICGPGDGNLCHKPNEYIEIADVERAVQYYKEMILRFLT